MTDTAFDRLIAEAEHEPFSGWDFSYIADRMRTKPTTWDYRTLVRRRLPAVQTLLDMGTGGGEVLASLAPLPAWTVATEAYPPNVEIARTRLEPLGVEVVPIEGAPDNVHIQAGEGIGTLPFADSTFELVINRHESYYPSELRRILRPGASFITQQVGGNHLQELNERLGAPVERLPGWTLDFPVRQLREADLEVVEAREEYPETIFTDIGAVVYYLRAVPWQVPDFTVATYRDRLEALHTHIVAENGLRLRGSSFYLEAVKRSSPS